MNPLVLIGLGVAVLALTRKKRTEPQPDLPDVDEPVDEPVPEPTLENHVVEEGEVQSVGGARYAARVWRIYDAPTQYLGELLLDPEGWTSGPGADTIADVWSGLQVMADSFDHPEGGLLGQPVEACEDPLPGPFAAMGYDPAQQAWVPFPGGGQFTHEDQPQTGFYWCVVGVVVGGPVAGFVHVEGRVTDAEGNLIYATGPEADVNVAASKAAYVALKGAHDLPWARGVQFEAVP
jgi:hypothetical protein